MTYTARDKLHLSLWDAGTEAEFDLMVKFTVTPAEPMTYEPPYPGCPAMVEDVEITLMRGGQQLECPDWLRGMLSDDDGLRGHLLEQAAEDDEAAREDAMERRADADREERLLERNDHV